METRALLDGEAVDERLAHDRGLHYGDGLFETMAWRDGALRFFDRHLARLAHGCRALGIEPPGEGCLRADLDALSLAGERCVVKLIVTRGTGGAGYAPRTAAAPRRLWLTRPWPTIDRACYAEGIRLVWLDSALAPHKVLAGLKHLNRLEQVLAATELGRHDADEGLVCDTSGRVIEAVSANVFMVRDGRLHTPMLDLCGVAGVMREVVIESAASIGVDCVESVLRRADFAYADQVFLTSSIRGVVPVRRIGGISYADMACASRISQALADEGIARCG